MFTQDSYPPSKRDKGDFFGRRLPPMLQKYLHPRATYAEGNSLLLSSPRNTPPPESIKVKITKPIDIGFVHLSQCVLAQVEDGPPHLHSRTLFLKIFDSQYVNPDDIQVTIGTLEMSSYRTDPADPQSPTTECPPPASAAPPSPTAGLPSMHSRPGSSASSDSVGESTLAGSVEITRKGSEKLATVDEVHSMIIEKR